MKRITAVVTAGAFGVAGFGLAVPALASADPGSPAASTSAAQTSAATIALPAATGTTSAAPLTNAQKDAVLDFLAAHPQVAQGLAARAKSWNAFVSAHPDIKAELAKVQALPAGQRKAELKKWLAANPAAKTALQDYRRGLKVHKLTQQKDRLDKRLQRLQDKSAGT